MTRFVRFRLIAGGVFAAALSVSAGAQSLPQRVADLEARLAALDASLAPQTLPVDCSAGGSIMSALSQGTGRSAPLTVQVSGTCTEQVTIARSDVTIVAASAGAGLTAPVGTISVVFIRGGQRVRLVGLTVSGGQNALSVSAGAAVQAQNVRLTGAERGARVTDATLDLSGSTIDFNNVMGLAVSGGGSATATSSVISNNGFHGVSADGGSITLRQSTVEDNGGVGVFGWRGAAINVEGGAIQDNAQAGIGLQGGATVQVDGGTIVANNTGGIGLFFGAVANLRGVTVENNTQAGVTASGGSSIVFGATAIVRNNAGDGVKLGDTSVAGAFSASMQITGNTGAGIRCDPAPAVAQITSGPGGFSITLAQVFGNAGPKQIACPGF